jgi:hypothetical protein
MLDQLPFELLHRITCHYLNGIDCERLIRVGNRYLAALCRSNTIWRHYLAKKYLIRSHLSGASFCCSRHFYWQLTSMVHIHDGVMNTHASASYSRLHLLRRQRYNALLELELVSRCKAKVNNRATFVHDHMGDFYQYGFGVARERHHRLAKEIGRVVVVVHLARIGNALPVDCARLVHCHAAALLASLQSATANVVLILSDDNAKRQLRSGSARIWHALLRRNASTIQMLHSPDNARIDRNNYKQFQLQAYHVIQNINV